MSPKSWQIGKMEKVLLQHDQTPWSPWRVFFVCLFVSLCLSLSWVHAPFGNKKKRNNDITYKVQQCSELCYIDHPFKKETFMLKRKSLALLNHSYFNSSTKIRETSVLFISLIFRLGQFPFPPFSNAAPTSFLWHHTDLRHWLLLAQTWSQRSWPWSGQAHRQSAVNFPFSSVGSM